MKFLGKTHKIILWSIMLAVCIWIEFTLIKMWFVTQHKKTRTFPCTYISGSCTKKPTYNNCLQFGDVPIGVCESRLNYGDFRAPND